MQVGAIAPSSRRLADAIAGQVPFDSPGWIIELGGGTGVVTDALLRRGLAPARLVVIERDPLLHRHLVERFPHVQVILGDAAKLADALRPLGIRPPAKGAKGQGSGNGAGNGAASGRVAAIISGLPLLTFPRPLQDEIVHSAFAFLAPGAPLLQFTYGPDVAHRPRSPEAGGPGRPAGHRQSAAGERLDLSPTRGMVEGGFPQGGIGEGPSP